MRQQPALPKIAKYHWAPYEAMREVVLQKVNGLERILEIGPGTVPFPPATEFVDWQEWPQLQGKPVHAVDINSDPLPFEDNSFDFVYCRHTLEDIYNPVLLCKEMSRVGRSGFIETPSPIVECTRGVDGGHQPWRGYCHHRHLIWDDGNRLMLLPKLPLIEYVALPSEAHLIDLLNESPLFWNSYFFWEGDLNFTLLQHDKEFKILKDYPQLLDRAVAEGEESNRRLSQVYGV